MTRKFVKATSKGQITLPRKWRNQFKTDHFIVTFEAARLVISPMDLDQWAEEEVIFDAKRDNDGQGLSPDDMIKLLKKSSHG